MRNDYYPKGTVQALLLTDKVTPATRSVLHTRLERPPVSTPKSFDSPIFITLHAVCERLIPQPDQKRLVDLAGCLDSALAEGKGNGWRYDAMPEDSEAFRIGLHNIDMTAVSMFGSHFHLLTSKDQDDILTAIQSGAVTGAAWNVVPAKLFFEELLAALVELYYSHPFAKEDIGEVAMADANGWEKISLNELEAQEPETLKHKPHAG